LLALLVIGGFFRFYKLDWGSGYFFHPDERNVISLAMSLSVNNLIKGTFAYGSLTAFFAFLADSFRINVLHGTNANSFEFTGILLRMVSAVFSCATIITAYFFVKRFFNKKAALISVFFIAFAPGLIQAAHFLTFESLLTFLYLLNLYWLYCFFQIKKLKFFFFSLLTLAFASALKINSALLLLPGLAGLAWVAHKKYNPLKLLIIFLGGMILFILVTLLFSPYYLSRDFINMLVYEKGVVSGSLDVFYTRQFIGARPVVYQIFRVLPYIFSPFAILTLIVVIVMGFSFLLRKIFSETVLGLFSRLSRKAGLAFLGTFLYWLILFLPNAFLFSKWSRYMIPPLPYLLIMMALFIDKIKDKLIFKGVVLFTSFLWTLAFMSVYFQPDVRITASKWIFQNIKDKSYILSETANVVDIPLYTDEIRSNKSYTIKNFDFYNLDFNPKLTDELVDWLAKADYIFIPSNRLFAGMGKNKEKYPLLFNYYQLLFSGKLGFEEIKKFDSFPQLLGFKINDEGAEGTWTVFDHPVIRIYAKTMIYSKEGYLHMLSVNKME